MLVALVLVLLSQLDDLLEDFHVKALSLRLCEDFLFLLVQLLQFSVQVLDPKADPTLECPSTFARNSATWEPISLRL